MALLVLFLLLGVAIGGVLLCRWWLRERAVLNRDRARLKVVEGQLATFRALLRLNVSEHLTRQQMIRRFDERR